VMVCEYPPTFSLKSPGEKVDSLIELLEHPARMDSEKIGVICLIELDEELWMG